MSLRETIIVSIMLLAMLLAGYIHFVPQTKGNAGAGSSTASPAPGFAEEILSKLNADTSLSKELFVIRSTEQQWGRDPFAADEETPTDTQKQEPSKKIAEADGGPATFVYSGFLQAGTVLGFMDDPLKELKCLK